jgi:hypothetical protein
MRAMTPPSVRRRRKWGAVLERATVGLRRSAGYPGAGGDLADQHIDAVTPSLTSYAPS